MYTLVVLSSMTSGIAFAQEAPTATSGVDLAALDLPGSFGAPLASDVPGALDIPGSEAAVFDGTAPFVVGASRRRQSLQDAPASVSIVTGEEIRRFGWRTITDVLSAVRGLYVTNDHNYSYVGVRGFSRPGDYNTRILVMINGHTTNDATYSASALGREFGIDMDLVERIEVIRGAGSALYGSSALLAIINVVTRTGPDVRNIDGAGVRGTVELEADHRVKSGVSIDRLAASGLRVMLSGSYDYSAGRSYELIHDAIGEPAMRTDASSDAMRAVNLFGAFSYGPLSVTAAFNRYEKNVPTGSYGSTLEAGENTHDSRALADARLDLSPLESFDLTMRVFVDAVTYGGFYPYPDEDGGAYSDSAESVAAGAEVTASYRAGDWGRWTIGATGNRYYLIEQAGQQPMIGDYFLDRHDFYTWAAFTDAEIDLGSIITLSIGGRYDSYGTFGDRPSPRLALIVRPLSETTVKLIYGQAFRAPSIYELYYYGGGQTNNLQLGPELLESYEAIIEQALPGNRGTVSLIFFHYDMTNLIDLTEDENGDLTFRNLDHATALGAELEISARLPWLGVRATAGYTFSRVVDPATDQRISNSPLHVAQLRLSLPIYEDRIFLAGATRLIGDRAGVTDRPGVPAAVLTDVTLTFDDILPGFDASLGASNLFDAESLAPSSVEHAQDYLPQEGRTIWTKLSYLF